MKFYLHTLGCPENLVDAEEMASRAPAIGSFVRARVTGATASRLRAIQE